MFKSSKVTPHNDPCDQNLYRLQAYKKREKDGSALVYLKIDHGDFFTKAKKAILVPKWLRMRIHINVAMYAKFATRIIRSKHSVIESWRTFIQSFPATALSMIAHELSLHALRIYRSKDRITIEHSIEQLASGLEQSSSIRDQLDKERALNPSSQSHFKTKIATPLIFCPISLQGVFGYERFVSDFDAYRSVCMQKQWACDPMNFVQTQMETYDASYYGTFTAMQRPAVLNHLVEDLKHIFAFEFEDPLFFWCYPCCEALAHKTVTNKVKQLKKTNVKKLMWIFERLMMCMDLFGLPYVVSDMDSRGAFASELATTSSLITPYYKRQVQADKSILFKHVRTKVGG